MTEIIGFVSGKGGVGKTSLVAGLAVAAARRGNRVLTVDGDLGLSSLEVVFGLNPRRTIADVLSGECGLEDAIVRGPCGIDVIPAASGRMDLTCLHPQGLRRMLIPLFELGPGYDQVLIDIGPGVSPTVVSLALACDRLVLVATPDLTSLADAYATLKIVTRERRDARVELVVNLARDGREVAETHARLARVALRFLDREPPLLGGIYRERLFRDSMQAQKSIVEAFPMTRASKQLERISENLSKTSPTSPRDTRMDAAMEV